MSTFPTMGQVEAADRLQLARWYRFLRSPATPAEAAIVKRLCARFNHMGGFTPELSKAVGW